MSRRPVRIDARGMTVAEVANDLGVSPNTVRKWIRAGELVAHRISDGEWRIRHVDYLKYLDATNVRRWAA